AWNGYRETRLGLRNSKPEATYRSLPANSDDVDLRLGRRFVHSWRDKRRAHTNRRARRRPRRVRAPLPPFLHRLSALASSPSLRQHEATGSSSSTPRRPIRTLGVAHTWPSPAF